MENFIINPENYKDSYIKNLNECFNGWGGEKEYNWVFTRKVGAHSADIMLIENEENGVIAGSGVSYRTLSGNGKSAEIGIMTGSWTLPAARRKGCFTKMIHCSKDLCRDRNVPFLTAFVTETNASSRRLKSEGSYMFPTYHLFSPEKLFNLVNAPVPEVLNATDVVNRQVYEVMQQRQKGFVNFDYTLTEFTQQYIDRINETTILKIGDDFAILENGKNEVKVLLLTYENDEVFKRNLKIVSNWCLKARSRKIFLFTTRKNLFHLSEDMGFENLPGYFTILNSFDEDVSYTELFGDLNINMADKM